MSVAVRRNKSDQRWYERTKGDMSWLPNGIASSVQLKVCRVWMRRAWTRERGNDGGDDRLDDDDKVYLGRSK